MFKKALLLSLFFWGLAAQVVLAADMDIVCSASGCNSSGGNPLFKVEKWLPGNVIGKTLSAVNQNTGDDCHLTMDLKNTSQLPVGFGDKLFNIITGSGGEIVNKTLGQMFDQKHFFWQTIPAGQSRDFIWQITFDPLTGNAFQGAGVSFDFDLTFACGVPPAPTLTLAPPVGCTDAKPGQPVNFSAVSGPGVDQVSLSWTAPDPPYTYFLVAYSDSPDWPPKWGNPDVGNTAGYVVSGLGTGTYWFWLRAGNGCMPGDFVGPISAAASGQGAVAAGFLPGVLGVETEVQDKIGQLGGGIATGAGEVAGTAGPVCPFWWMVLMGQTLILGAYLLWLKKKEKKPKFWFAPVPVIVLLAYFIDHYAHTHWFLPSLFCRYELVLGLILAFLQILIFVLL